MPELVHQQHTLHIVIVAQECGASASDPGGRRGHLTPALCRCDYPATGGCTYSTPNYAGGCRYSGPTLYG